MILHQGFLIQNDVILNGDAAVEEVLAKRML